MSETVEHATIRAELFGIARELIDDGFTVYYLPSGNPSLTEWLIFGKADDSEKVNVGTVSYDRLDGFTVDASIRPTRGYGSAVVQWYDRGEQGPNEFSSILEACRAAAQPTVQVRYIKGAPRVPNDGIQHFDWCADRLVNLT